MAIEKIQEAHAGVDKADIVIVKCLGVLSNLLLQTKYM